MSTYTLNISNVYMGIADTRLASSAPFIGRVKPDTLMASSGPYMGRVNHRTLMAIFSLTFQINNNFEDLKPSIAMMTAQFSFAINSRLSCLLKVLNAKLDCMQNLYYAHDFSAILKKWYSKYSKSAFWNVQYKQKVYKDNNTTYIELKGGAPLPRKQKGEKIWTYDELLPYVIQGTLDATKNYTFAMYTTKSIIDSTSQLSSIQAQIPLSLLASKLSKAHLLTIAMCHNLSNVGSKHSVQTIAEVVNKHQCIQCFQYICLFDPVEKSVSGKHRVQQLRLRNKVQKINKSCKNNQTSFPPMPSTQELLENVISEYANNIQIEQFLEAGCAVCGLLTPKLQMTQLSSIKFDYSLLKPTGLVTRKERKTITESIAPIPGPVLLPTCEEVCNVCAADLQSGKLPHNALANGLWIGEIPTELQDLSWTEKMLISKVKHNMCIVKVHVSGMHKMKANVVSHSLPMPKIYNVLPPAREELDDVLAFLYIGPNVPTYNEYKRTPMLVRRNKVAAALEWLKLNHADYADLTISYDNLNEYPEDEPPVIVNYTQSFQSNKDPEATAVNDTELDEGAENGECPFIVHGLTGTNLEHLGKIRPQEIRARAVEYFKSGGKALGIGQEKEPESLYNNPQLYPQMFPWLFPYGLGGLKNHLGSKPVSEEKRKQQLLMYHDKRFQLEPLFPLVALNHEQIKKATRGGFLLADKAKFNDIADRLLNLKESTLATLIQCLQKGPVKPETEEEKACFQVLNDLDHVSYQVQGSITSKKYMRNEIWSLVSYLGAPSWFITFAPADVKHPIALYFADTNQKLVPKFRDQDERLRLIANNPVAGARIFQGNG